MQSLKSLLQKHHYNEALKLSSSLHNPPLTTILYTLFIKSTTFLTPFESATLITHFSRTNLLSRATFLLRFTRNPDTVVFNSLISSYSHHNLPEPAFELFNTLRELHLYPDEVTFSSLIKCCYSLRVTESVHVGFWKLGFGGNVVLNTGLIEKYASFGGVSLAEKCFEECVCLDEVVWSVMINGYVRNGEYEKARECFMKMKGLGFKFNEFSLSSLISGVVDVNEGGQIHGCCVKNGYLGGGSMYLNNAVMVMYGRCGCKRDAVKVFDEMPEQDFVSWTGRISVAFDCVEAFEIFKCCVLRGYELNEYTLINVLSSIEGVENLEIGKQIHNVVLKSGYLVVTSVCNALISMYSKSCQMDDARQVFDEMLDRDSVSWNSVINGYSQHRCFNQAIELFSRMRNSFLQPNEYTLSRMRNSFLQPNEYTLSSILDVLANLNSLMLVMQIHSLILKLGFMLTDSILCRLITAYGKCNDIDKSKSVYSEIDRINVDHVNAMAGAYDHCGCYHDILTMFHNRRNSSLDIDIITFNIVLKSCGALSDLHQGKSLHSLLIKTAISENKFIESGIIDVYSKCGSIEDAENVFQNAKSDNLVAYNAMIMGFAQFGCYSKAYDLFTKITEYGMKPDEITYLGILSSCSHAGIVNEAKYHLSSMFNLHGVIPCLEHYACVVDVFGKVGKLNDAKKTIDNMPMIPDARIWQILLSACNIYKNVDIGMIAARKLAALQPENESSFVLLSNIYASAGLWSDVRQLRREMKDKVVSKEAGCSWIQVKESLHYFYADDKSHPQNEEIYVELRALKKQMVELSKEQDADAFVKQFLDFEQKIQENIYVN